MSHDVGVHGKSTKQHPGFPLRHNEAQQDLLQRQKVQLKDVQIQKTGVTLQNQPCVQERGGGAVHRAESQGVVRPVWMALELGLL